MTPRIDDDVMTLKELAKFLKVHYQTARKLVLDGDIAAAKIGRDYKILKSDALAYVQKQKKIRMDKLKKGR